MYTCTLNHVRLERYYVDYPQSRLHHILHYIHRVTPNPYFLTHTKETPCCTISRLAKDSLKNAEKKKDISVSTIRNEWLGFCYGKSRVSSSFKRYSLSTGISSSRIGLLYIRRNNCLAPILSYPLLPTPTPRVLVASGPLLSFELCQKI